MIDKQQFLSWLQRQGAEVLAPTNGYEYVRFRARGAVHVLYEGRRGITATGFGEECLDAFCAKQTINMGLTQKARTPMAKLKFALVHRDGNSCFFCLGTMPEDEMTVEHLVARHKGGPDHMDNMALAHKKCNEKAGNLPLMEKIKVRGRGGFSK